MLQFALPWLFLLLPLPWVMRRLLPEYRQSRPAVRVPFMKVLRRITGEEGYQGAPTIRRLARAVDHADPGVGRGGVGAGPAAVAGRTGGQ